jgi:hypothetical protein
MVPTRVRRRSPPETSAPAPFHRVTCRTDPILGKRSMSSTVPPRRILAGSVLVLSCLAFNGAFAQSGGERDDAANAGSLVRPDEPALSDLIFDTDFEGERNGGTSCATANPLTGDTTFSSDTTASSNWMASFGPLLSPSNDVVYTFLAGPDVQGSIVPTVANYTFAMYLMETCSENGTEPTPIGATATLGRGIDLAASGVISGHTYYLAITAPAGGGPGANGILNFTTPASVTIGR